MRSTVCSRDMRFGSGLSTTPPFESFVVRDASDPSWNGMSRRVLIDVTIASGVSDEGEFVNGGSVGLWVSTLLLFKYEILLHGEWVILDLRKQAATWLVCEATTVPFGSLTMGSTRNTTLAADNELFESKCVCWNRRADQVPIWLTSFLISEMRGGRRKWFGWVLFGLTINWGTYLNLGWTFDRRARADVAERWYYVPTTITAPLPCH